MMIIMQFYALNKSVFLRIDKDDIAGKINDTMLLQTCHSHFTKCCLFTKRMFFPAIMIHFHCCNIAICTCAKLNMNLKRSGS